MDSAPLPAHLDAPPADFDAAAEDGPQPPVNLEAEQALLAAILASNRCYDAASDLLLADHFADPVHGRIYAACGALIDRGGVADAVTLKNVFERDGDLAEIGGAQYLAELQSAYVTIINAEHYARTIHDLYLRRRLIDLASEIAEQAQDVDLDRPAADLLDAAQTRLVDLDQRGGDTGSQTYASDLDAAIAQVEAAARTDGGVTGIPTGLRDLDDLTGGLHAGRWYVIAGRPAMGKSALARQITLHAARQGYRSLYVSAEMPGDELALRDLAQESGIDGEALRQGRVDPRWWDDLVAARTRLAGLPLRTNARARTTAAIRAECRRMQRREGLDLLVVDYLQLLVGTSKPENRVQEISRITRDLKVLAGDLGIPVIALSQLNRGLEQREDKRPMLSDLRESGTIEQDADLIAAVYREHVYAVREEPRQRERESDEDYDGRRRKWLDRLTRTRGAAELIVLKQRQGRTGTLHLGWQPERTLFTNDAGGGSDADTSDAWGYNG